MSSKGNILHFTLEILVITVNLWKDRVSKHLKVFDLTATWVFRTLFQEMDINTINDGA